MELDTGLELNDLTKFIFISLDYFLKMRHNRTIKEPLDAWLLLLSSDLPEDICRILAYDPVFGEIYRDIVNFQFHPKELIGMYSETLRLMDQNTIKFMIDEQKELLAEQNGKIEEQKQIISRQEAELVQKDSSLAQKDSVISELKRQLAELQKK